MKRTALNIVLGSAALAACVPARNAVDIDVSGSPSVSGVVVLCDQEIPLTARGEHLTAAVPITCEGVGEARLSLGDGATATCQIGYVSPGLDQEFSFALERGECVPIPKVG
jgi:hypothetical protein